MKDKSDVLVFYYKNYRGEHAYRRVLDPRMWFGSTAHHKERQWIMTAFDVEKDDFRDFAVRDIVEFCK